MSKNNAQGPLYAVVSLLIAGAALAAISFSNLGDNLVYYWTPTELVAAGEKADGAIVRLGGQVEPGSISWEPGASGTFRITDGTQSVLVQTTGVPPQMFREGIGVVVEGDFGRADSVFHTQRVMVKHSNEYRAPEGEHDVEEMYKSIVEQGS